MKYAYVDIGCADFCNSFYKINEFSFGIMVDPNLKMLAKLLSKPNILKCPFAISNENKIATFYYLSDETVRKYRLPSWMRGCSTIDRIHPTLLSNGITYEMVEKELVAVISWTKFLELYNIEQIQTLKIDIEGMDCILLESILETYNRIIIQRIEFEINSLTPSSISETINKFLNLGYEFGNISGEDFYLQL